MMLTLRVFLCLFSSLGGCFHHVAQEAPRPASQDAPHGVERLATSLPACAPEAA
jgi:hypothetical protein